MFNVFRANKAGIVFFNVCHCVDFGRSTKAAEEQILDALVNAREVGVPRGLTRREIYEKPLTPREAAELCMLYGKSVAIGKTRNTLKSTVL
jgi:hypothetical protein